MSNIPQHIGIIMDGNRRWARERSLPTFEGHRRGYNKIKEAGDWCLKRGIKILTVYAFSTENWNRSQEEVSYLMNLLKNLATKEVDYYQKRNVRVRFIGRISQLSADLQSAIAEIETKTKDNTAATINVALNYGGRSEIVDGVKKIIESKIPVEKIDEKNFSDYLYTKGQADPDLIIRTSGEQRLSGFLLWQGAYSELYFVKTYWPDFSEQDLDQCLEEYSQRQRRFGGG